jgi:hypothetical protein
MPGGRRHSQLKILTCDRLVETGSRAWSFLFDGQAPPHWVNTLTYWGFITAGPLPDKRGRYVQVHIYERGAARGKMAHSFAHPSGTRDAPTFMAEIRELGGDVVVCMEKSLYEELEHLIVGKGVVTERCHFGGELSTG